MRRAATERTPLKSVLKTVKQTFRTVNRLASMSSADNFFAKNDKLLGSITQNSTTPEKLNSKRKDTLASFLPDRINPVGQKRNPAL